MFTKELMMFKFFDKKPSDIKAIEKTCKSYAKNSKSTFNEALATLSDKQLKTYEEYFTSRYKYEEPFWGGDGVYVPASETDKTRLEAIRKIQEKRAVAKDTAERESIDWDKTSISLNDLKLEHYQKFHEAWQSHYDRHAFSPAYYENRFRLKVKLNNRDYVIADISDWAEEPIDFGKRNPSQRLETFVNEEIKKQTLTDMPEQYSDDAIKSMVRDSVMSKRPNAQALIPAILKTQYMKEGLQYEKEQFARQAENQHLKQKIKYRAGIYRRKKSGIVAAAPETAYEKSLRQISQRG